MREEDSNRFSRWEKELPSPEDLIPLSQTLISPDLAAAFDIRNAGNRQVSYPPPVHANHLSSPGNPLSQPSSTEFADSAELGSGTGEEPARTLKRPRLVWTPQLHKRFVDAVAHLGIKNAVPKTIMQLMSVDGLTRENVASHLQKYRLYLKRMQGMSANGGGGGGAASVDPATDHLFASSPVPPHLLHPAARPNSEHFSPYVPVQSLQQHHHHHHHQQQMVAAASVAAAAGHLPFHRQMGHFGLPLNGHFEVPFVSRQAQNLQRMGTPMLNQMPGYVEDMESANASGGRKVLTLFPTGDE